MLRDISEIREKHPEPGVISYTHSPSFFRYSQPLERGGSKTAIMTGFKCRQCGNYSKHGSMFGYCFIRKKMMDANEGCVDNTRNTYENINLR